MMEGMRRAGQSLAGRIVIAILFGFLIFSFAIWGIGDMIRNWGGHADVASVGSTPITQAQFRQTYQTDLQNLSRRAKRGITNEEARQLGIDQQVLQRMLTEATLDHEVKSYGLAISDATIAKSIMDDPNFKGADGNFDRLRFDQVLRDNGFNEPAFVRAQRSFYLRQQVADTIGGGMPAPALVRDALHRYRSETRDADTLTIGAAQAGDVAAPDDAALKSYFDANKASFRAPEFRKVAVLTLKPGDLADPAKITDADAKAYYDRHVNDRFGSPERREVQQMVFPSAAEAQAASEKIKAGTSFADIAAERKLTDKDLDLGNVTRDAILDPKVAEAAFSTPSGGVSEPVDGKFGTVIVKVGAVQPGSTQPFEQVRDQIKTELSVIKAKEAARDVHDKIEDQRASAKPLAEIAKDQQLPLRIIDAIDRGGRDKDGNVIRELTDRDALIRAIFSSDIGVDNEALATNEGGWTWFDVQNIAPPRERTLDEVRPAVVEAWKADQVSQKLADKAADLVKRVQAGTPLADVAKELGVEVKPVAGITRQGTTSGLSPATVSQIFGTPVGSAAAALGATPGERVVFVVTKADVPPLPSSSQEAEQLNRQISIALGDDVIASYVAKLQSELGVTVNEALMRQDAGN
jgi:peptidyl-prolyl cis-trans isomerase D